MNKLHGTCYDGRTSRAEAVRLALGDDGMLRILSAEGEQAWPIEAVRISPRLGRTPRILQLPDGSRIEAPDAPEFAAWFEAAPSRIEGFADWLERRRWAIAGAAAFAIVAVVLCLRVGVPWAAREVAERAPPALERSVSDQVVAVLERMHLAPSRLPAERRRTLQQAFARLVAGEPRAADLRLEFVHAPEIGPNAFALPDGRIFMTDALVELAGSDAELLAVLAHEAGHHHHRHGMRQALESSSVFLLVGMLAGDVSGSSLAVSVPAVLLSNGFSRGHEREADAYAFDLLRRRGQSPRAFAGIMRRLAQEIPEALEQGPMGYLSTHPASPERIAAAERAAAGE